MKRWLLAAGLLAAAVAPQAFAADLDDGEPHPPPSWRVPPWKDGAYGYPPRSIEPPPGYFDGDEDGPPYRRKHSYHPYKKHEYDRHDDDDDGPPPGKYGSVPPPKGCVRSEEVRDRLTRLGWRDFHAGKAVSGASVTLRARRPSGRLFELRLDRCSGEILHARALDFSPRRYGHKHQPPWGPYGYGPYAYGPPPYKGPYGPYGSGKRPPSWDDED